MSPTIGDVDAHTETLQAPSNPSSSIGKLGDTTMILVRVLLWTVKTMVTLGRAAWYTIVLQFNASTLRLWQQLKGDKVGGVRTTSRGLMCFAVQHMHCFCVSRYESVLFFCGIHKGVFFSIGLVFLGLAP